MSLSDLANVGTFVSALAVLASLLYLSLQMRQTARNQAILIQQQRLNFAQTISARAFAPDMVDIWVRGRAGDETLSDTEMARFTSLAVAWFQGHEDDFLQHRAKLLDAKRFAANTFWLRALAAEPGLQAVWKGVRMGYDVVFREYLDALLHDAPVADARASLAALRALTAAEVAKLRATAA